MQTQINTVLDEIRSKLEEEWATDEELESVSTSTGGEGGAENATDVEDKFSAFMDEIVDALLDRYEADEDDAIGLVFDVIDEMVEEGELDEFPSDEASEEDLAIWMGKATTAGLKARVLQAARDSW